MHWYDLTVLISLIPGIYAFISQLKCKLNMPSFVVILSALLLMMPESPVFLLAKGKEKRARESLQWLRGTEYDISEEIQQVK